SPHKGLAAARRSGRYCWKIRDVPCGPLRRKQYSEVANFFVHRIDDRLPVRHDLVHALIEVQYPSESLGRGRNVVALRTEHDDRRLYVAQIDDRAVRGFYRAGCEVVTDEQLIDDELDFLGIEGDVTAPPALETQVARYFGVDLGIKIVLLAPHRIRRIEVFEILHQPSAVELAVAEITGERRQPAAAEEAAAVAHRAAPAHAGQIGQGSPRDDDRAE